MFSVKKKKLSSHKRKAYIFAFLAFVVLVLGLVTQFYPYLENTVFNRGENLRITPVPTVTPTRTPVFVTPTPFAIKPEALIGMPYTVQAPNANWKVHEESCEEAAALMYHYFLEGYKSFNGKTVIPPDTADKEMVAMKKWQVERDGKELDLSIDEWGRFVQEYYGYKYEIFGNISKEDIEREISKGHPVVVPVITHSLENPHYGANPSYHVLLIKGYKQDGVITNDAGIKEGEGYFYKWDILFKAIDAANAKIKQGRTMAILTK